MENRNIPKDKHKILLIDDEKAIRMSAEISLNSWFEITAVSTTTKAAELIARNQYDLVLLDMLIHGEGVEDSQLFLKMLNEKYPQLPVIILSGSIDWMKKWDELKKLGACGYLSKPFDRHRAKEIIERCISGEKFDKVWGQ